MPKWSQISCKKLNTYFEEEKSFVLLDVREPSEYEICRIDGSILVPLSEIEEHLPDFDQDKKYVVYCKLGDQSKAACEVMKSHGFKDIESLSGGIIAWANDIETNMEKY